MRNKKSTYLILSFIIFSLLVLILTKPAKRKYYTSYRKEKTKYEFLPGRKPKNRYK